MESGPADSASTAGSEAKPKRSWLAPPWKPGQSGNPSGRAKVARPVSSAYAELLSTPGRTLKEQLENYRDARGDKFCAADMVAIGMLTSAVNPSNRGQTSAAGEIADRTEGKVTQGIDVNGSLDIGSAIAAAHSKATGGA